MNNKILLANEIITLANHFVLCMFFFIVAQVLILGAPAQWYYQLLFVFYLGVTIAIRLFITSTFFIYMGLHLVLFGTIYFLPLNNLLTIECIIYLLILTLQSADFWKRNGYRQNASLPWPSVLAMFCFYIYAIATHQSMLCTIIYIIGTVYLLLYLARLYLTGLYELANSKTNMSRLPLKQIVKTNSTLVGLILAIIAITILLANIFNLDNTLFAIGNGLIIILRYIIAGFIAFFTWIGNLFHNAGLGGDTTDSLGNAFSNLQPEASLLTTIFDMLFKIFQCVVFGLIIFWIFRGMYRISKRFLLQNMQSGDHVEGLNASKQDNLSFMIEAAEEISPNIPHSKIRKRYKKAILKHNKDIVLKPALTTNEIDRQLPEKDSIKMKRLKEAYENTRYYLDK